MKLLFVVIYALAALPVDAADPQPFAPASFQLELPNPTTRPDSVVGVRLDFPLGPVCIDYGIPIRSSRYRDDDRYWARLLDSPGPGYQEQKAKALNR